MSEGGGTREIKNGKEKRSQVEKKETKDEKKIEKWDQQERVKEENELGKSLVWVAGVGFKEVEKIEEKTTRVEKKGEKSERKREKRGPGRIFAWAAPLKQNLHKFLILFDF